MRKTVLTPEMIAEIRRRYAAGEALSRLCTEFHLDFERGQAVIADGDLAAYTEAARLRQLHGQRKAGHASAEKRKGRSGLKRAGFIWKHEAQDAKRVEEQQAHLAQMTRLKRVRVMTEFSPEELTALEAKLHGWIRRHAGLEGLYTSRGPWGE